MTTIQHPLWTPIRLTALMADYSDTRTGNMLEPRDLAALLDCRAQHVRKMMWGWTPISQRVARILTAIVEDPTAYGLARIGAADTPEDR